MHYMLRYLGMAWQLKGDMSLLRTRSRLTQVLVLMGGLIDGV